MFGYLKIKEFKLFQAQLDKRFKTFHDAILESIRACKVECMTQDKVQAHSNQLKHTGLDERLIAIETILADQLKANKNHKP